MIFKEKFLTTPPQCTQNSVFERISPLLSRPFGRFGRNTPRQPSNGQNLRPAIASI